MAAISGQLFAQTDRQYTTVSPYSQFGLGIPLDQSQGFYKGMNGVGLGFREHNMVNTLNPASYSAIDSLSFIFDAGVSGQLTHFEENGKKKNAKSAAFDYVVAGFRAFRHVGVSFGLLPYSNVGYNYSNTEQVGDLSTTYTTTNYGSGGLHQAFLGIGWEPFKGFSLGVNGGYLWGNIEKAVTNTYSDASINSLSKNYKINVSNYTLNFGAQFSANVTKNDNLTLGVTYGFGHKLSEDLSCNVISTNTQTSVLDTAKVNAENMLKLPHTFGAGLTWNHRNQLKVGFDFTLQKWADVGYPELQASGDNSQFALNNQYYLDRKKFNLGMDYCVDEKGAKKKYLQTIHYRLGVSYATPYLNIAGKDGPKEISVSAGFGIPIINGYNNRSILNISAQWVRNAADNMLTENTFRINIGFTFNERWFMKWKVN